MESMRLTIDIPLPDDPWEARPAFLTKLAEPLKVFRAAMAEAAEIAVEIKREIVSDAPAPVVKRGRPAKVVAEAPMPHDPAPLPEEINTAPADDAPAPMVVDAPKSRRHAA